MSVFAASYPDWPPSPPTVSNHVGEPEKLHVPLSCVPPSRSPVGFDGLADNDWNWIVLSPSLIGVIVCGIARSSRWQSGRSAGDRGLAEPCGYRGPAHAADGLTGVRMSTRAPPPSEPTNAIRGSAESKTTACSSGWRPLVTVYVGAAPRVAVASAHVTSSATGAAALVERMTARPLDRGGRPAYATSSS